MPRAPFDFRKPDYPAVFAQRIERLKRIRAKPECLPYLQRYYADNPADFINDWGCTVDPRNIEIGLPAVVPFILFERQREWVTWVVESWRARRPGVTSKSREVGVSWLAIGTAATLCLTHNDMKIGFGSRKLELVDKLGDPKSLFWKAREFIELLPDEFRGGWTRKDHSSERLIQFPNTKSTMTGEGGDEIGRGDRQAIYFVDEASKLEHPDVVEHSLSQTTNCRMDIGTANGIGNPFYRKVTQWPKERVFIFHWRADPRKDDAWYEKQCDELDPVTVAQEIDIDFAASLEGVVIPSAWIQAAIDAHIKLGITPTGARTGALDVADEGRDLNAFAAATGVVVDRIEEWSGKGSDIYGTVVRAFGICDELGLEGFRFDSDGLGAGVRGDSRVINGERETAGRRQIVVQPFRGSSAVIDPLLEDVRGRKNEDYFANRKAQSWWALRKRFQTTFRAVTAPGVALAQEYSPDDIISLPSGLPFLAKLTAELSQPTYSLNNVGKIVIDKAPDGTRSPNLADAVMILYGRADRPPMRISQEALDAVG